MKKVIAVVMSLLILATVSFSQSVDKADEVSVSVVGQRFVKLEAPNRDSLNTRAGDAVGFAVDYTHFPKNGIVGVQGEFALVFDLKDTPSPQKNSVIAMGTGFYGVVVKPRNKKITPYGRALIGVALRDFQGQNFNTGGTISGNKEGSSIAYGGGGGLEFRLKEGSTRRIKTDVTYFQTRFSQASENTQHNLRVGVGLVF